MFSLKKGRYATPNFKCKYANAVSKGVLRVYNRWMDNNINQIGWKRFPLNC